MGHAFRLLKTTLAVPMLYALLLLALTAPESQAQQTIPDDVLDIFDENCAFAGCHVGSGAPRGLDLSEDAAFQSLVGQPSAELPRFLRVNPGDPQNSYLIKKLLGTPDIQGERMPKGSAPLSNEQIRIIAAWIQSLPPETASQQAPARPVQAFPGWSLANLPTPATPPKGGFVYRISHRFRSPVNSGFARLFGLDDGAFMMTQVGLPITNDLTVTLGRSKINTTFELSAKWRFMQERSDGTPPLSLALHAGVEWATLKEILDPEAAESSRFLSRTDGERFTFFAQLSGSKRVGSRLSLLVVPGILLNGNVGMKDEKALITLGLAGKFSFNETYGLFVEAIPILSGEETVAVVGGPRLEGDKRVFNDTFSAGIEIKAGGHVFHVFVTNSAGNTTNQYLSGGNFDVLDGDFRLGFNIYRILKYPL